MKRGKRKKQIKRIQAVLDTWIVPLGLGPWGLTMIYSDDPGDFRDSPNESVAARVWVRWEYMSAEITFNLKVCAGFDDHELESAILHELSHVMLDEVFREREQHHLERACSQLARVFCWIRNME